ncbi:hypothetical protein MLE19_22570 [Halomonas neptunia]|uniref:Uncharacterized protein n=1 Tax=Vreelandella neptunia TaxID=115551 RepID=A0ABS9SD94_9GAMM|nr:hypothetical protein [Halomonas neptunia]
MLQIDHRDSHDVDLFINDIQLLPYFNPETQDYDLTIEPSGYVAEAGSLKVSFDGVGEIDVICCSTVTDRPSQLADVAGRSILRETPAEIIAKKIVYRGSRLQPRDMFDIAAVSHALGEAYLVEALSGIKPDIATALRTVEQSDDRSVAIVVSRLLVKPDFRDVQSSAKARATDVLRACLLISERN